MFKDAVIVLSVFVGLPIVVILLCVAPFYFEAQSYNKYCKTPMTTWDAIWLDLRVDMCEKK